MQPEQNNLYSGHMHAKKEILFFGPDENTAGFLGNDHWHEMHCYVSQTSNWHWASSVVVRAHKPRRFMDLGADIARERGYPYWKSLTTGKSVSLGAVR